MVIKGQSPVLVLLLALLLTACGVAKPAAESQTSAPAVGPAGAAPASTATLAVRVEEPTEASARETTDTPPLNPGEVRQWASSATASSEFSNPNNSAEQATGEPNTPECGDQITAWASVGGTTTEWLELTYASPVRPTMVNIVQSYLPNQVVKVELRDTDGEYHEVDPGEPGIVDDPCPFILAVPVEADYTANGVRITVDQTIRWSYNEIDAVELVGTNP